jgi:hypothetical protein
MQNAKIFRVLNKPTFPKMHHSSGADHRQLARDTEREEVIRCAYL